MAKISAGLLMYWVRPDGPHFLLVHPGGPYWKNKDLGAWTIPKGELAEGEDPFSGAQREFEEELGIHPEGHFVILKPVRQKAGKIVHAWGCLADLDVSTVRSNTFMVEWPPHSGQQATFPEVDRAEWFDLNTALEKINPAQRAFIEELKATLAPPPGQMSPSNPHPTA